MLINSGKALMSAKHLAGKKVNAAQFYAAPLALCQQQTKLLHTTAAKQNYAATERLPLPNNVDAAETTRFSPLRSRDITATVMSAQAPISTIDITADNTMTAMNADSNAIAGRDPHVQSYDCFGAVSLNSVMQSNVPTPFGGMHKFTHLNMPGGQWSQEYKFTSQNMHSSHYRALRDSTRADWTAYDQNATMQNKDFLGALSNMRRHYSTKASQTAPKAADTPKTTEAVEKPRTKQEQLKQAFKDYGSTIVIFHVGISLISLGGFYLLISSGVNVVPIMEFLGVTQTALADKIATGSTFVVAYAVHKVFAPLRLSITLGATPFIVRYLRSKGFLKPKNKTS